MSETSTTDAKVLASKYAEISKHKLWGDIMADLTRKFAGRRMVFVQSPDGHFDPFFAAIRSGEKNVVDHIAAMVEAGGQSSEKPKQAKARR